VLEQMPRCGDGSLAPHEWIKTLDGDVMKLDAGGHDLDPTWTGRQPLVWDLAGAILEWDLDPAMEEALRAAYSKAGGYPCAPLALDAYRAAYAAHRVGQVRIAHDAETDPVERSRLERAYERWRAKLARSLPGQARESAGTSIVMASPRGERDSARALPPWRSTISRTIASPSPEPPASEPGSVGLRPEPR